MNKPTCILLPADTLRQALAGLGRVIPRASTLPVLHAVRVIRDRGTITLAATDLDLHLLYTHRTEPTPLTPLAQALAAMRHAREPAEGICIPSAALRAAARATGDICITADRLTFSTGAGETTLPFEGIAVDEFPWPEDDPFSLAGQFDSPSRTAFLAAAAFVSHDVTRFVINGVHLESRAPDGKPCAVPHLAATDGRRLYCTPFPAIAALAENIIVPTAALTVLGTPSLLAHDWLLWFTPGREKIMEPAPVDVRFYRERRALWDAAHESERRQMQEPVPPTGPKIPPVPRARFIAGPWGFTCKLIEGNFPNWRQCIPNFTDAAVIPFTDAQAAQLRAILAQWPKVKIDNNAISLAFPGTGLRLSDSNGTAHLLPGVRSSLPITFALNRQFLADALRIGTPVIRIFADDCPMHLTVGAARMVIMPLRIEGHIPIADAELEAATAQWLDCTVRLPDRHEGRVLRISRNGSKCVATVSAKGSDITRVPLATMKLVKRPEAKAA